MASVTNIHGTFVILGIRSGPVRFYYAVKDHFHVYYSLQTSSTVTPIVTVELTCFGKRPGMQKPLRMLPSVCD